jgi:hypothetical protein
MRSHHAHTNRRIAARGTSTTIYDFAGRTEESFDLEFSDYGRDQPLELGWWLVPVILLACGYTWIASLFL